MPILRKESDIFPEELFSIDPSVAPWVVVHVRSRQEKRFARFLRQQEIPFYLPQVEQKVQRSGRTFVSYIPLFGGYVFSRRTSGWDVIWRSDVVVSPIEVPDQQRLTMELGQIRSLQEAGATLVPARPAVAVGDAVRITEGSFRDYVGVVRSERGTLRLLVSVTVLKKTVAVEFPREVVAPSPAAGVKRRQHR